MNEKIKEQIAEVIDTAVPHEVADRTNRVKSIEEVLQEVDDATLVQIVQEYPTVPPNGALDKLVQKVVEMQTTGKLRRYMDTPLRYNATTLFKDICREMAERHARHWVATNRKLNPHVPSRSALEIANMMIGGTVQDVACWTENQGTSSEKQGYRVFLDNGNVFDIYAEGLYHVQIEEGQ
jgi:hypothetical protein